MYMNRYIQTLIILLAAELTCNSAQAQGTTGSTGPTVKGSVYGGGNLAHVGGSVTVNMIAGTVDKDVYGGGALANTNTNITTDATIKTTVNLLGGTISGDAYGGGLGRQADNNATPAVTAVEAKVYGDVKIYLNGMDKSFYDAADATMKTVFDTRITKPEVATYYLVKTNSKGAVVKRVFGANNKNGSPQRNVTVHVFGTQHKDAEDIRTKLKNANADLEQGSQSDEEYINVLKGVLTDMITKAGILHIAVTNSERTGYQDIYDNTSSTADDLKKAINDINDEINAKILDENTSADDIDALFARIYDVEAVYGGGNEAAYIPTTAYHPTNAPTGSKTQVIIEGCDETSIEAVYGGGNAASVPETNVDIVSAHEIQTVFGGGNGKDNKSDGSANPGADVGVYKVGTMETIYGTGNATTKLEGGYFHEAYGASNSKGNIKGNISINTNPDGSSCNLKYDKLVGAGKNADVDKDVIMILGCNPRTKNPLIFGGADNANVNGNVELTITSGTFGKVFGGNNLGGIIKGHIKVNIEETECTPIRIDELYLGGNQAAYSRYGYYKDGDVYKPRTAAMAAITDPNAAGYQAAEVGNHNAPYDEPVLNVISCTYIGKVFGGGYGERAVLYGNPTVNINMIAGRWANELGAADKLGEIVDVFGGGNAAKVEGNTTVNIGTATKVGMVTAPTYLETSAYTQNTTTGLYEVTSLGANITGNVYGGGNQADVTGNTFVNICAVKSGDTYSAVAEGTKKVNIAGNVFGGGKGVADNFYCDKAMVGTDKAGETAGYLDGNTSVIIGNGTVNGSVYGGGEVGRVEMNTTVTIGLPGEGTSAPDIKGDVFGGGKGEKEHGYAALVRGNPTVTIQANAKVEHNVYGGGEIASVARYKVPLNDTELAAAHSAGYTDAVIGRPYALKDANSGFCTVTVKGKAVIGPDTPLKMYHADSNGNIPSNDAPDDAGHVFGAGKGIMPENYAYDADQVGHKPRCRANDNSWTWFGDVNEYIAFIQTLALSSQTTVTIGDDDDNNCKPFIKGSVYGGSENGLVQFNTNVYIESGQIGWGKNAQDNALGAYDDDVWAENYTPSEEIDLECPHWDYGIEEGEGTNKKKIYAPYDPNANATGDLDKYPPITGQTVGKLTEGGRKVASDGHTYYGNVFGGGSGSVPYFDTTEGISKYLNSAGTVKGNTNVTISGGHILTNVYGGCEATNVLGKATIKMTNGTIGVPRTKNQIIAHPVTCYLFGAGKGDQRVFFNKDTNVENVEVEVSGGRIYGSVFGGGEDGHVMRDVKVTIGQEGGNGPKIGTLGSTYVDGNVFGGGRGFGGEALTSGNVGGTVGLTINGGEMLGSVYGGGRLASVGYGLYLVDEVVGGVKPYGVMRPDNVDDKGNTVDNFKRGYITVTINGGTIGKEFADDAEGEHSGNVFGGSMGRLTKLDGSSFDDPKHWTLLATAKSTTVNINGGIIKRSVYGGGEMGTVTTDAIVNVSGGTIGTLGKGGAEFGNVYGGGKGYVDPDGSNYVTAGIIKGNTKVTVENGTNTTPTIYHNIYGGGAYGSVGTFTYDDANNVITGYTSGGKAEIYVTGGTIGTDGKENGMIFGSSRGDVGATGSIHDKLAWVYDTHVAIGDTTSTTITTATPLIKGSVYGGGENGHNYRNAYVRINGGTIGIASDAPITDNNGTPDDTADDITYSGAEYPYRGNVYGGGCGTDKYYSTGTELHDGNGDTYNPKSGIVQGNAIVHISAGNIVRNVYGAGAMGSVGTMTKDNDDHLVISSGGKTTIEISGGTIGVDGTAGDGNVFGAARGDETTKQTDVALVKTTDVTVSGNSTVWGNVYGGGQIGCVGTFTERAADGKYIWTSDAQNLNGLTKVSITGGETKGHVFGAGKGSAVTFKCEKAMVKKTQVSVSNGKVDKNVYGGGEIGRVEEDTDVKIGVGDGTCTPTISGSVYGAGAGLETHGYSALVRHNTTVTVDGGATIGQSVYGGGEIASVGRYGLDEHKMPEILLDGGYCYVKVQGSATIGSTTVQGNVFGACKGVVPHFDKTNADRSKRSRRMTVYTNATDFPEEAKIDATTGNASSTSTNTTWEYYDESVTPKLVWEYFQEEDGYNKYLETLALATHPEVTIDGSATVNGSVYGGGEMGITKGSVMVNILGGTITEDVYGGGALANTNTTSAVGVLDNAGIPQKESDGKYQTTTVYPKTTVNLLGGSMRDAYGGGLGQLAVAAQGTEGQAGYQAAVSAIEAKVFGDVKVNLNGLQAETDINTTLLNSLKTGGKLVADGSRYNVNSSVKGAVVNRVFGCNNLNGTPTKKVQVYVFGTQKSDKSQLNLKAEKNTNTYDVQAVYGGGNLAKYEPVDALLEYNETNKATVDAARPEVYIDGCDLTSIKQVYGGGNAASVPATFVEIRRCYEIDEVFGGGNGFDNYSVEERGLTVWHQNPGANVGYYDYTHTETSGAKPGTEANPYYLAVEDTEYAGGADHKEARLAAKNIQYGSGIARLEVKGGTIHTSYGGSNSKGNVRAKLSSAYSAMFDDCEMQVAQSYGGGKNAYSDAETDMVADCAKGVKEMFGGAKDADMDGDINMLITNGSSLERVFGGNNTSGAVNGSITITLQEGGCEPIKIGELYAGGFLAPYSVYGYEKNEDGSYKTESVKYLDENNVEQTKLQRIPLESGTRLYKDPRINVISATSIGNIFGGGYQAKLVGNPHINVNMTTGFVKVTKTLKAGTTDEYIYKDVADNTYAAEKVSEVSLDPSNPDVKSLIATTDLGTIGNIYGGGNMADIVGDTYVEIGTGTWVTSWNEEGQAVYEEISPARNGAKITGNVFGGGKGKADSFKCAKAMVGAEDSGSGSTNVIIGNGTIGGTVYGGGEIGRVEANTNVTIGLEEGTGEPVIEGNVFGAGRGAHTHGYAALVRGNTTVTVQGEAKVRKSVYGGGEIASVGKYNIADAAYHAEHPEVLVGMPYSLVSDNKGICNVIVKGNAVIGPEGFMEMKAAGGPDDTGHVFGAGKGVLPYHDIDGNIITDDPWRVKPGDIVETFNEATFSEDYYTALYGSDYNKKLYNYLADYLRFIETLALTTQTEVTIGGNAFVKGSVYGGSENGHVQHNTHVTIQDDCQIGHSEGVSRRFTEDEWRSEDPSVLKECASWDYVATEGAPYDPLATSTGTYDYTDYPFVPEADRHSRPTSDGGKPMATDGHTYYGNVFGGGSGVVPYAPGRWHREAGSVGGNTQVDITGGHIMTSVYGGNEQTDVGTYELDPDNDFQPTIPKSGGKCTINMRGGTLGVPRTPERMKTHPVTCYLFGAGKGDQRIFFNTWTNVINTEVNISGTAKIYGSTFGGGEDGHVILNAVTNISGDQDKVIIGTTGTSYVDGNVFGGGRGFSGEAQTAGTVGGNVEVNISGGTMLGSIYGGGRLASVGTLFTAPDNPNYGNFVEDGGGKTYGHVAVNISGGIIGNTVGNAESGNVFGGSMGRLTLLDGTTINPIWPKMAQVKEAKVTISGDAVIKRNVYGGGELGTVRDNATVNIYGGTVNRDVYGAGYGSKDYETKTKITVKMPKEGVTNPTSASDYDDVSYVFTPMIFAGCVGQNTYVNIAGGKVRKSVYGGGEMASVGIIDCRVKIDNNATDPVYTEGTDKYVYKNFHSHLDENNGFALSWPFHFENAPGYFGETHVNITGGRIGIANGDTDINTDNGDVYGGGKGIAGEYKNYVYCANVGSAEVTIDYPAGNTATPQNYMTNADIECIAGAVYGGAENGHVMGDTKLTLKNGLIGHSMYGGGSGKGKFSTTLLKIGSTSEHYTREIYSITAGKVFGNSTVEMSGGTVVRNVYGGGNMGSVGKGNYAGGADDYSTSGYGETLTGNLWDNANDYSKAFLGSGKCTVNITGGTVGYIDESDPSNSMYPWNSTASLPYGNVFGGCRGESAPNIVETPRYLYSPEFFVGYANETTVTIGKTDGSGPTILGSVYGGGMDGHIRRDASVTILGGEIGIPFTEANKTKVKTSDPNDIQWLARGNVYGSGSGIGKYKYDFDYDGKYESTVKYNNGRATVDTKEEDYSTSAGSVTRFTTVDIKGGTIHRNVYGGGSLSSIGAPKIGQSYDPYHPGDSEHSSEVGKQSLNKVTISGGQIGDADCLTSGYGGDVNGGSRGAMAFENSLANPASFANSVYTEVTITDDADVKGNVFGGGEAGIVKQDTEVKMQGGTVGNDLYGGGDLADVGGNTVVDMTGGTIKHDAFGGARGTADVAAEVKGKATVTLNGTKFIPAFDTNGILTGGRIFGANNVNGTPKGHVKVHVLQTVDSAKDPSVPLADRTTYDVGAVYGGGNNADYKPTETTEYAEVIIDGCEKTSIKYVFGGGNAAATPANEVMINGCYIIDNVFGGGNGTVSPANVGYDEADYKTMGTAKTNLSGGYIHNVYGGSNNQGNILGGASVTNEKHTGEGCCDNLQIQEIYGGGKQADMFGGAEIVLGCMPNDWIGAIYAGAENADVGSDVSLTLTSGKFERVFGGNKSGGRLNGGIELNIEENPGCSTPIIIGELYGGGNEAPYSIYGYKGLDANGKGIPRTESDYKALSDAQKEAEGILSGPNHNPVVNVKAFTSIGNIFGGGYGGTAVMIGNPIVNINEVEFDKTETGYMSNAYGGETKQIGTGDEAVEVVLYPHEDGKMGVIGNVFGGGNSAEVIGNPNVNIGTAAEVGFESLRQSDGSVPTKPVVGADIRGNVYGGGNNAAVTGDPKVVIGQRKD